MTLPQKPFLLAAALIGVVAAGIAFVAIDGVRSSPSDGFDLAGQPPAVVAHYQFAEAHPETMSRVPCYCGCGQSLQHASLLDCFLQPDGGYDGHASVCLICQEEAEDVARMLAGGTNVEDMRRIIDEEYGKYGPPTKTP